MQHIAQIKPFPVPWSSSNLPSLRFEVVLGRSKLGHVLVTYLSNLLLLPDHFCGSHDFLSVNHLFIHISQSDSPSRRSRIPHNCSTAFSNNLSSIRNTLFYLNSIHFLQLLQFKLQAYYPCCAHCL